jgi:hypothetical protein
MAARVLHFVRFTALAGILCFGTSATTLFASGRPAGSMAIAFALCVIAASIAPLPARYTARRTAAAPNS